ncbi:peptidoglycan-binding domain-containing protein [Nonlabens xiamenensis]|uniref:peptidoglycan-binding domain-containing protein n=1 Tax=Nonlabens xiamenensis TaxID=2341043 RepID=UPI000F615537|nr:peptidoglycan-binding domain-containing protein [Nonlabens xiamenensis]
MKQIIIFLLLVILGFIVYDFYGDWRRFHPSVAAYKKSNKIDVNYHDSQTLRDYYKAVAALDNFVQLQWTAHDIDLRYPESDDDMTWVSLEEYADLQATVAYYERKLEQSAQWKAQGWDNERIRNKELGISQPLPTDHQKRLLLLQQMLKDKPSASLEAGDRGPLVFEAQRLLVQSGQEIPVDGVYSRITSEAVQAFEEQNNLYPDGQLDVLTFSQLIKNQP